MNTRTIRIDRQVEAAIRTLGQPGDTPNSTLRGLLGLPANPEPAAPAQGQLAPLLQAGLVRQGDEIIWYRPRKREHHRAVITAEGMLRIADGTVWEKPSRACFGILKFAYTTDAGAWDLWHTTSGQSLDALRTKLAESLRTCEPPSGQNGQPLPAAQILTRTVPNQDQQ